MNFTFFLLFFGSSASLLQKTQFLTKNQNWDLKFKIGYPIHYIIHFNYFSGMFLLIFWIKKKGGKKQRTSKGGKKDEKKEKEKETNSLPLMRTHLIYKTTIDTDITSKNLLTHIKSRKM